jgi:carbohydrate kinase (thermoresistant glucokinase family)
VPGVNSAHPLVLVMGVSGSGKSTIGALVADALAIPFIDGDSLHPQANIEKMASGQALDDDDRWPWLAAVGATLADASGGGMAVACSALKRLYRDTIRAEAPHVVVLGLAGSREVLSSRLQRRSGHFMPSSLLDSQLATLEPLEPDESGLVVNIDAPVATIVSQATAGIQSLLMYAMLDGDHHTV